MSVREILQADPAELERWAKEWLKATAENIRSAKGNEAQAKAVFNAMLSDIESLLAILTIVMVKEEYQPYVADLFDAIRELQASLRGTPAPPVPRM